LSQTGRQGQLLVRTFLSLGGLGRDENFARMGMT
jgi:hypothetical protein